MSGFVAYLYDGSSAVIDTEVGGEVETFEMPGGVLFARSRTGWVAVEAIAQLQDYVEPEPVTPRRWWKA